ncbi:MAG: HAD family hydrolase, partial [Promethearchaeota archaeon]
KEKLMELKQDFTLGIVTSKKEDIAKKLLKYLEIDSYFDYILGETEARKSKTHPSLISYLRERYRDYKFVIIGDHLNDRALAEALGCPFIGVLTGFHAKKQLTRGSKTNTIILNNVIELEKNLIRALFN